MSEKASRADAKTLLGELFCISVVSVGHEMHMGMRARQYDTCGIAKRSICARRNSRSRLWRCWCEKCTWR